MKMTMGLLKRWGHEKARKDYKAPTNKNVVCVKNAKEEHFTVTRRSGNCLHLAMDLYIMENSGKKLHKGRKSIKNMRNCNLIFSALVAWNFKTCLMSWKKVISQTRSQHVGGKYAKRET